MNFTMNEKKTLKILNHLREYDNITEKRHPRSDSYKTLKSAELGNILQKVISTKQFRPRKICDSIHKITITANWIFLHVTM